MNSRILTVVILIVVAAVPDRAWGQYFGRNKVEYTNFAFRVLSTAHFDVYYYPQEERAARLAAALAERWYRRLARLLDHELDSRQALVLYGSQPEFAQTNVVAGLLSDSVGGVTESTRRRIAMPLAPTLAETDRVLGHEIAHAFQFDIGRRYGGGWTQPLWFIEGMAEYLARGPLDHDAKVWLRDAVRAGRLPDRERDAARRFSPYQYGHAFWAFLVERYGDEVLARALKPGKRRGLQDRMQHATGVPLDQLYQDWRTAMTASFADSAATGHRGLARMTAAGHMQLGPALSPDGRLAVFFSERDRFSLDLFLGDVKTGRVLRKLATTTANARFDSLQAVRSAGAWSPDGRLFAFAATRSGHAVLVLLDVQKDVTDQEIAFPSLGQILAFDWSPTGDALALSALAGGITDLYRYDMALGRLDRLTNDEYADLHPSWSPDGRTIAFATERYHSDLASLRFGPPQLASLDLDSGSIAALATADAAQINPQWADDGRLYFVSNPAGIPNVFALEPDGRALRQVTRAPVGVTGLTPTSAALSVAAGAAVLAFTEYSNGRPQLRLLDGPVLESMMGPPVVIALDRDGMARQEPDAASTADGEPDDPTPIVVHEYAPRLSLERIGQPYISTGGGAFGTFVRGGGGLLFGDLLGQRRLAAALQVGNRLRDAAFEVRYLNQERRWNWGAAVELEPGLRRYRRSAEIVHDAAPARVTEIEDLQRVRLAARGLLAYPFNRGLRVEFAAGVHHSSYRRELRAQVAAAADGRVLDTSHQTMPGGAPTTTAEFGVALVGDTATFGATAPLVGARYRLELTPAVGHLTYVRALADYRRYLMPIRPFTIAVRLLHSGRYGRDGDDERLAATFLGSRYLVRGHGLDSRRCVPDADRVCGGELLGSRLVVANLEVRVPLWGSLRRQLEYGPLPADLFVFADGGMIRSSSGMAGRRARLTAISSVGGGIRLNAGGLPFELLAVRALDGPAPGWTVDYGFRVGF